MSRLAIKRLGVKELKEIGDEKDILEYLNNICASFGGSSTIKELVLYPKDKSVPYLINEVDGFLYKIDVSTFLIKKGNNYTLKNCLTPAELIKHKINSIHGDRIAFISMDDCDYKGRNKAVFNCPTHGNFTLRLCNAFDGRGCQKCGFDAAVSDRKKGLDDHIDQIREAHGDKYKYLEFIKVKNESPKILVECPFHGQYTQYVKVHITGVGCPKCARQKHVDDCVGFSLTDWISAANKSKRFDTFKVYVIKCTDEITGEVFYKVGRTFNTVNQRYKSKNDLPYDYEIISVVGSTDPEFIYKLENEIKSDLTTYKYIPKKKFGGMKECFSKQPILNEYIHKY